MSISALYSPARPTCRYFPRLCTHTPRRSYCFSRSAVYCTWRARRGFFNILAWCASRARCYSLDYRSRSTRAAAESRQLKQQAAQHLQSQSAGRWRRDACALCARWRSLANASIKVGFLVMHCAFSPRTPRRRASRAARPTEKRSSSPIPRRGHRPACWRPHRHTTLSNRCILLPLEGDEDAEDLAEGVERAACHRAEPRREES